MSRAADRATAAFDSLVGFQQPAGDVPDDALQLVARSILPVEFPDTEWIPVGATPGFVYVQEADGDLVFSVRTNAGAAVHLCEPNPQTGGWTRIGRFRSAAQLGLILASRRAR